MLVLSSFILLLLLPFFLLSSIGLIHSSYDSLIRVSKHALKTVVGPPAFDAIFRRDANTDGIPFYMTDEEAKDGTISLMISDRVSSLGKRYCITDPNLNAYQQGDIVRLEECRPGDPTQSWGTRGRGSRHAGHVAFNTLIYSGFLKNSKTERCLVAEATKFGDPGSMEDDGMLALGMMRSQDCGTKDLKLQPEALQFRFDPLNSTDEGLPLERIYPKAPLVLDPARYNSNQQNYWDYIYSCPPNSAQTIAIPRLLKHKNDTYHVAAWGCCSTNRSDLETAFASMNPSPLQAVANKLAEQAKLQPSLTASATPTFETTVAPCVAKRDWGVLPPNRWDYSRDQKELAEHYDFFQKCDEIRNSRDNEQVIQYGCNNMHWPVVQPTPLPSPSPTPSCS